jgi:TolA-binding protein
MIFRTIFLSFFLALGVQVSHAQTINFERLSRPGPNSFSEGFAQGQRERLEQEQMQLRSESLRLQNEKSAFQLRQMEEQQRAQERQRQQQIEERQRQSQPVNQPDPIIDAWLKAAAPRMGLYPDFEKVVFSAEVAITTDMIRLMTPSPFAADIAYYLGRNKIESMAISKMTLVQAARSIDQIELRLKSGNLP